MSSTSSKGSEKEINSKNLEAGKDVGSDAGVLASLKEGTTPGVKNIEAAYSRAGATKTHTPGTASKLGSVDDRPRHGKIQGVGNEEFENRIQDQRPEPSVVGKAFDKLLNGSRHVSGKNSHD